MPPAGDLEPLDPLTGEALDAPAGDADDLHPRRTRRVRQLRRLTIGLAALALVASVAAAYAGIAVSSLRSVEDTWRQAIVLDQSRASADREILDQMRIIGDFEDPAVADARARIGDEAAAWLRETERTLRDRRIADAGVSRVRDTMADALLFRSRQMSPGRIFLGDGPLRRADAALADELHRWRLPPRPASAAPRLREVERAMVRLRSYADVATGVHLLATDDSDVVAIDVDGSTMKRFDFDLPTGADVEELIATSDTSGVVLAEGVARGFSFHADRLAVDWVTPASTIAANPSKAGAVWVSDGVTVTEAGPDGPSVTDPRVRLPAGRRMVGATAHGLVLTTTGLGPGPIELWNPLAPDSPPAALGPGNLVAAGRDHVAIQVATGDELTPELRIVTLEPRAERAVELPPTDAGPGAFTPDETEAGLALAFAAGPAAGRIAGILVYDPGHGLRGPGGPSAAIAGHVVWSTDGRHLFWLTPAGRIAVLTNGREPHLLRLRLTDLRKLAGV